MASGVRNRWRIQLRVFNTFYSRCSRSRTTARRATTSRSDWALGEGSSMEPSTLEVGTPAWNFSSQHVELSTLELKVPRRLVVCVAHETFNLRFCVLGASGCPSRSDQVTVRLPPGVHGVEGAPCRQRICERAGPATPSSSCRPFITIQFRSQCSVPLCARTFFRQ